MQKQPVFLDVQFRLEDLSRIGDPLMEYNKVIEWEKFNGTSTFSYNFTRFVTIERGEVYPDRIATVSRKVKRPAMAGGKGRKRGLSSPKTAKANFANRPSFENYVFLEATLSNGVEVFNEKLFCIILFLEYSFENFKCSFRFYYGTSTFGVFWKS